MLQQKYLPYFHFSEKHSIRIAASPRQIFALVNRMDFRESFVIRMLYRLRGMPGNMLGREGMSRGGFITLEQQDEREIIIGVIGKFWKLSGNLMTFNPEAFRHFRQSGFARATWNFEIIPESPMLTTLETETRVECPDKYTRRRFSLYWFFVRPFSGIIRQEMLKAIKRKAERQSQLT
jgi:hypothetical protein